MRKVILKKIANIIILIIFMIFCGNYSSAAGLDDFQLAAENEFLALFLNRETTEIAVQNKNSGEIWYSNPPDDNKTREQLIIHYYDPADVEKSMDNYEDSIKYGQFEIYPLDKGIKIKYMIGKQWDDAAYVPQMISKDRFEKMILKKVSDKDRRFLLKKYTPIFLVERGSEKESIQPDKISDDLFADYTLESLGQGLSSSKRNDLAGGLLNIILNYNDDIDKKKDITFQHLSQLIDNPTYILSAKLRPWDEDDLVRIFRGEAEYTPEDKAVDHSANHLDIPGEEVEVFTISVEYRLDGDNFIVKVPVDELVYPENVISEEIYARGFSGSISDDRGRGVIDKFGTIGSEEVTFPLHEIELLPYFGSSGSEEQGYMFVPDGSGGLIYLDKDTDQTYIKSVYGKDYTVATIEEKDTFIENQTRQEEIYLPVYGMKRNKQGFLAVIEEGDSLGKIVAKVAGRANRYNRIYSRFLINPVDNIKLLKTERSERGGTSKSINVYPESLADEDIQIRYIFLNEDKANYAGMALVYQKYLKEKYNLEQLEYTDNIPFFLELVGTIPDRQPVMGIMRLVSKKMTTYPQVKEIVEKLMDNEINNIKLKYSGWLENGVKHVYPSGVDLDKALGSSEQFRDLINYLNERGIEFYPEVGFMAIHNIFNYSEGYNYKKIAAERLNKDYASYSDDWHTDQKWVLSPNLLDLLLDDFLNDYLEYNISGLALKYMGYQINSDYRKNAEINRPEAADIIEEQFHKIRDKNYKIMVEKANIYTLPYIKNITYFPLTSSTSNIIDKRVPFYQIVVHGYVNYAGIPVNLSEDIETEFLRALETGSLPYFKWSYADSSSLINTDFTYLYSIRYDTWFDLALDYYHDLNQVLKKIHDQRIIKHQEISDNVYLTGYENGKSIIVNYNDYGINYQDIYVQGKGYSLLEEGKKFEN